MTHANAHSTDLQTCSPKTADHRRGMRWFASLTQVLEADLAVDRNDLGKTEDDRVSLQHSLQLYGVFVETGDPRYLNLANDFLRYTLEDEEAADARAAQKVSEYFADAR